MVRNLGDMPLSSVSAEVVSMVERDVLDRLEHHVWDSQAWRVLRDLEGEFGQASLNMLIVLGHLNGRTRHRFLRELQKEGVQLRDAQRVYELIWLKDTRVVRDGERLGRAAQKTVAVNGGHVALGGVYLRKDCMNFGYWMDWIRKELGAVGVEVGADLSVVVRRPPSYDVDGCDAQTQTTGHSGSNEAAAAVLQGDQAAAPSAAEAMAVAAESQVEYLEDILAGSPSLASLAYASSSSSLSGEAAANPTLIPRSAAASPGTKREPMENGELLDETTALQVAQLIRSSLAPGFVLPFCNADSPEQLLQSFRRKLVYRRPREVLRYIDREIGTQLLRHPQDPHALDELHSLVREMGGNILSVVLLMSSLSKRKGYDDGYDGYDGGKHEVAA